LNAAFKKAVRARLPLYIPAGDYTIGTPVVWLSHPSIPAVLARDVRLNYTGRSGDAVTYGAPTGQATNYVGRPRIEGLCVRGNQVKGTRGLVLQNLENADIDVGVVANFDTGVVMRGDNTGCAYNRFRFQASGNNVNLASEVVGKGGWANRNTFYDCRFGANGSGTTMISARAGGWAFNNCSFEAGGPTTLLSGSGLCRWSFRDCWFECGSPGFTFKLDDRSAPEILISGGFQAGLMMPKSGSPMYYMRIEN
jgi:hypothetical protein